MSNFAKIVDMTDRCLQEWENIVKQDLENIEDEWIRRVEQ
jgi:hypothetical protein